MLFIKYIENIIENYIDSFFCNVVHEDGVKIDLFLFKKTFYEIKDIFTNLYFFKFEEFGYFLKEYIKNADIFKLLKSKLAYVYFYLYIISDIFLLLYTYIISHLWLSNKIYEDYVHNEERRDILKILNMFFLFLIFIILLLLI
jgi:hypothetical protein